MESNTSNISPLTPLEGSHGESLNRSCEPCRGRKIRCQQVSDSQTGRCVRCEKMKLTCMFKAPNTKRPRKRTSVRVTELEKELQILRERLEESHEVRSGASLPVDEFNVPGTRATAEPESPQRHSLGLTTVPSITVSDSPEVSSPELLDIDESTEQQLYSKFIMDLTPHLPFVQFSGKISIQELRATQPTLFLAIMTASSASLSPSLARAMSAKLEKSIAERVIVNGEKSLSLIQALLITASWYHPPDRFKDLKFTQYAHIAANMTLDIQHEIVRAGDAKSLENQRAFVACYLLCSSMAVALRRPNMLKFSNWTNSCIQTLQQSAIPSDNRLSAWARLQHIAEEAMGALGLDDQISRVELFDSRIQSTLKSFERQLMSWKNTNYAISNTSTKIHFHYIRVQLHEISLHQEYEPNEFKAPYLMRPKPLRPRTEVELIPAFINAAMICVESTHSALDIFLSMDVNTLRSIPVIVYTRMVYAVVVLCKMATCAQTKESPIGRLVDLGSLDLPVYLHKLMPALQNAAGEEGFNVPSTFLLIISKLAAWYHRQQMAAQTPGSTEELLEPMRYMKTTDNPPTSTAAATEFDVAQRFATLKEPYGGISDRSLRTESGDSGLLHWSDETTRYTSAILDGMNQISQEQNILSDQAIWPQQDMQHMDTTGLFQGFPDFDTFSSMTGFEDSTFLAFATDDNGDAEEMGDTSHLESWEMQVQAIYGF